MLKGEGGYLAHPAPATFHTAVERTEKALKGKLRQFDSIFVTGLSGITVGAVIAHKYRKRLVVLRKKGEDAHGRDIEGQLTEKYIIIDDFTASGATLHRLVDAAGWLPQFVVLYGGNKQREVYNLELLDYTVSNEPKYKLTASLVNKNIGFINVIPVKEKTNG